MRPVKPSFSYLYSLVRNKKKKAEHRPTTDSPLITWKHRRALLFRLTEPRDKIRFFRV